MIFLNNLNWIIINNKYYFKKKDFKSWINFNYNKSIRSLILFSPSFYYFFENICFILYFGFNNFEKKLLFDFLMSLKNYKLKYFLVQKNCLRKMILKLKKIWFILNIKNTFYLTKNQKLIYFKFKKRFIWRVSDPNQLIYKKLFSNGFINILIFFLNLLISILNNLNNFCKLQNQKKIKYISDFKIFFILWQKFILKINSLNKLYYNFFFNKKKSFCFYNLRLRLKKFKKRKFIHSYRNKKKNYNYNLKFLKYNYISWETFFFFRKFIFHKLFFNYFKFFLNKVYPSSIRDLYFYYRRVRFWNSFKSYWLSFFSDYLWFSWYYKLNLFYNYILLKYIIIIENKRIIYNKNNYLLKNYYQKFNLNKNNYYLFKKYKLMLKKNKKINYNLNNTLNNIFIFYNLTYKLKFNSLNIFFLNNVIMFYYLKKNRNYMNSIFWSKKELSYFKRHKLRYSRKRKNEKHQTFIHDLDPLSRYRRLYFSRIFTQKQVENIDRWYFNISLNNYLNYLVLSVWVKLFELKYKYYIIWYYEEEDDDE